jgi:hypothetical protein
MFNILGIVNLDAPARPLSIDCAMFRKMSNLDDARYKIIERQNLRAVFFNHKHDKPSYHVDRNLHLFAVGEAFLRSCQESPSAGPLSAEELMKLYRLESDKFVQKLKGNFTVILVDCECTRCTLYNSRFGISPFYYALDRNSFLFSTSLSVLIKHLSKKPDFDKTAISELALFNYPLGSRTYFRNVYMLCPAEIVYANSKGLRKELWWEVRSLYEVGLFSKYEALEMGSDLFHRVVNSLASDVSKVCVSFTSGFDSRSLLAALDKSNDDVLTYSFGIPGSLNVEIPKSIAAELDIAYQPMLLDGVYEHVYDEYAMKALLLSDCLSTVERANYPYTFRRLADFSSVTITGLFGSELLRTFQNVGHIVSSRLVRLNVAADPCAVLKDMILKSQQPCYFAPDIITQSIDEINSDISEILVKRFGDMNANMRFYMFLLTEGLRKYFGAEVHMERPWSVNRFPFLDEEFVEFLFRSPFAGVYSRAIKPTVTNRYFSQYFYAYIIRKYRPELLTALTDHGYPPRDVLSPVWFLFLGPRHVYYKWQQRLRRYREFKTEEWTHGLYSTYLSQQKMPDGMFSQRFLDDFKTGRWTDHRLDFARAASFKLWLEQISYL